MPTPRDKKWSQRVKPEDRSNGLIWHHSHLEFSRKRSLDYYYKDKERRRANNKAWYAAHPGYKKAYRAKMKAADPEKFKQYHKNHMLKNKYGISLSEFGAMIQSQGGGCASCGGASTSKKGFHVDHDHKTGAIRGILCSGCNTALGLLKEDIDRMQKLIDYVVRCRYRRFEVVKRA